MYNLYNLPNILYDYETLLLYKDMIIMPIYSFEIKKKAKTNNNISKKYKNSQYLFNIL